MVWLKFYPDISRDRAAGISQIDHKKIVNSIHNQYQEKMKEKEVEVLEEKILTAKQEEKVNDLNSQIEVKDFEIKKFRHLVNKSN